MGILRFFLLISLFTTSEVQAQGESSTNATTDVYNGTVTEGNAADPVYQGTILQQPFKIGVGVRSDALTTDTCTMDEKAFMNEKFAEYTVALARLFFGDDTVQLTGNFTEIDGNEFDRFAFDDFNTYEKQKFDSAQVEASAKLPPANPEANTELGDLQLMKKDPDAADLNATTSEINTYPAETTAVVANPLDTCQTNITRRCVTIDFNEIPGGIPLMPGQYVTDEFNALYGMTISVKAIGEDAFAPEKQGTGLKAARIFDTSNPGNDKGLGSPNEKCASKGPGIGDGGKPNKAIPDSGNCEPQGNVLIIQQDRDQPPLSAPMGGEITFTFDRSVDFNSIGLMDIEMPSFGIEVVRNNGNRQVIKGINPVGANSVQEVLIGKTRVRQLVLYIPEKGAVTNLNYCLDVCDGVWDTNLGKNDTAADTSIRRGRQLRARTSAESAGSIDARKEREKWNSENTNRRLPITSPFRFMFIYGGQNEYTCSYCTSSLDRRNRELLDPGSGTALLNEREYLIAALESVMSFGLTLDLAWSVKYFLSERNIDYGCFGDGES